MPKNYWSWQDSNLHLQVRDLVPYPLDDMTCVCIHVKRSVTFGPCIVKSMKKFSYWAGNCQVISPSLHRLIQLLDLQIYYNRSCGLMDKALHFECGDCRFESCHDRNFGPFNQLFNIELVSSLD